VTDFLTTREKLRRLLNARVPLVVIKSIEANRALELVTSLAGELRAMPFYRHSRTEGLIEVLSRQTVSDDFSLPAALEHARTTYKGRPNTNFVFSDIEELDTETSTSRHIAEMVRLAEQHQGTMVILTAGQVWNGLSRLGMTVTLDLPTTAELFETLNAMIDDHRGVVRVEWTYEDVRRAAEILSGITEMEAVNVLATMLATGALRRSDIDELSAFKDQIFGELAGLERIEIRPDYEVGGLAELKRWLTSREALMKADLSMTKLHPPKGVLLCGVPGCGKSLSAKAIAAQWRLPLYRLDMGAILGMYVGQSEQRLREALDSADRMAPCVLWIDEIEKALASGGGDSGTSRRLIGQFLFWLQESSAKVFTVATANDVSTLPPELLRTGRFDAMFFVDLPSSMDREAILRQYFRVYLNYELDPMLCRELVEATVGFAGSDIEAVVHEMAAGLLHAPPGTVPPRETMLAHISNVVPYSQTNPEELASIRAWGRTRAIPAGVSDEAVAPQHSDRRRVVIS
jgi:hypothetical protein